MYQELGTSRQYATASNLTVLDRYLDTNDRANLLVDGNGLPDDTRLVSWPDNDDDGLPSCLPRTLIEPAGALVGLIRLEVMDIADCTCLEVMGDPAVGGVFC